MAKLFATSGDPDQTPHIAASDLGLLLLPITLVCVWGAGGGGGRGGGGGGGSPD